MYTGLCTNTHTHNLSKHTYSPENNYCMRIGGKQTHTHRLRHCHACRKTIIVCEDGTNAVMHDFVYSSAESLRALRGIG